MRSPTHMKKPKTDLVVPDVGGRPTKWTPKLQEELLAFFCSDKRWENRVSMEITKKNGDVVTRYERIPLPIPWLGRFEMDQGLSHGLLSRWATEEETLLEEEKATKRPGFLHAMKRCKDAQLQWLVQNGLSGLGSGAMHIFALKNIAGWRDSTDITSDGERLAQITLYLPERDKTK